MTKPISALPGDVRRRVHAMGAAVAKERRAIVAAAAKEAADRQELMLRRDTGGDLRLSGAGRRRGRAGNAKVGVRVRIRGEAAEVTARGPVPLIDRDVPGHVIRSGYIKGAYRASRGRAGLAGPAAPGQFRGDRRAVLNIPGVGFRRSARHPGTRGKGTWDDGLRLAVPAAGRVIADRTTTVVTKAFRAGMR